jgi:hypothetical protein
MAITEVTCPHLDVRRVEVQTVRRVVETSVGQRGEWVTFKGAAHVVDTVTTYECGQCGWTQ